MYRHMILASATAAICCILAPETEAQTAKDLVGTWTLVSADIQRNGYRVQTFGPNPIGRLLFSSDGHYALIFLRRDLPAIASHDRTSETADESQAIAQGSVAHFGTYLVNGKDLIFHIEGGTFPNWTGANQHRNFTLTGDELTYISPGTTGFPTKVTLRRYQ